MTGNPVRPSGVPVLVRPLVIGAFLLLGGCGPRMVPNTSEMSEDRMLARASHVFVGVIQKQQLGCSPSLRWRTPVKDARQADCWTTLRREVRIELMIRGAESRKVVEVYERFWICGASGDWNSTQDGERDLFLVQVENGRYHVVRDWWRSIFRVRNHPPALLPLDDSHPLWERIALMNWTFPPTDDSARPNSWHGFRHNDPGDALDRWRKAKLERGLLRHSSLEVRTLACELLTREPGQDECWKTLSDNEKARLSENGYILPGAGELASRWQRLRQRGASALWADAFDRSDRRLLTTINDPKLRAELCRLYTREYPGDPDCGCPADRPPPATIVTENGDVPLTGPWPR